MKKRLVGRAWRLSIPCGPHSSSVILRSGDRAGILPSIMKFLINTSNLTL